MSVPDVFARVRATKDAIEAIVPAHGGFLRCQTCGHRAEPRGEYMSTGWPTCCGLTMRWWTQRQIDVGEAP